MKDIEKILEYWTNNLVNISLKPGRKLYEYKVLHIQRSDGEQTV